MHPTLSFYKSFAAALLLSANATASTITSAPSKASPTEIAELPKTCEARTINYITDSLPQLCLKSSWSAANGTYAKGQNVTSSVETGDGVNSEGTVTVEEMSSTSTMVAESPAETKEAAATDLEAGELNEASFLSFEEWKKQTLEKAGQGNDIGKKRSGDGKKRDSEDIQNHLDSLGDEGEIDLDFGAFRSAGKGAEASQTTENNEAEGRQDQQEAEPRTNDQYRPSKDAGKTCKERFSYASFDAGATVVKTHPGAKNAKSVLIENKDSYMLSECSAENKFIIIELSEDIWIDTLVLANYEFFSSMFRTFRVSVSDRYPVKMEKWKDLGTHEARNTREIQAFLIENPQIWARYIRIEFLSHYGNEYYCPLSLVRVHGTRMLESWKETETGGDDDSEEVEGGEEQYVPEAVAEKIQEEERLQAELKANSVPPEPEPTIVDASLAEERPSVEETICLWEKHGFNTFDLPESGPTEDICFPSEAPTQLPAEAQPNPSEAIKSTSEPIPVSTSSTASANQHANSTEPTATSQVAQPEKPSPTESSLIKESSATVAGASNITNSISDHQIPTTSTATVTKSQNITSSIKNKTTSTSSSASALPTIQESFFKAVSRRLQLLETNSTLSLKYIEEQSRILREAFMKVEKKQLQKTTTFLDTLNSTVLDELRGFRQQYDEIWQSTVISLESQRDESRREILAISTRLNILADEVVFQKRMSIVQAILLLLCLGLVIFSRVSGGGNIDFGTFHSRGHSRNGLALYPNNLESPLEGSPPASPDFQHEDSGRWLETGHRRVHSDDIDTAVSRSRSRDESPPTPISTYSRSDENAHTPPSGADDMKAFTGTADILPETLEATSLATTKEDASPSPSSTPKKRRRKSSIRCVHSVKQQETPPPDLRSTSSPPPPQLPPRQHPTTTIPTTNEVPLRLPSPPPDATQAPGPGPSSPQQTTPNRNFTITRKPLPALPPHSDPT
ncbi:hypothetical protein NA56DRAFT_754526 [Hyaloscypha hepaticicola]|uniref:SUN domain-containing protein n=1 Tax=Hyaloscypha hepaticicola TaxID=2082293 RepID=A0A2J6PLF9_9HELO|nr:hypothetical protein NA56DRAFT_754526 [Hyaloscypha hepaticicola]